MATGQLNARARPWVRGRPAPSPRYRRRVLTYRILYSSCCSVTGSPSWSETRSVNHLRQFQNHQPESTGQASTGPAQTTAEGPCQRFARNCATRNLTPPHHPTLAAPFICSVAWVGEVVHGDVNHPHIDGSKGSGVQIPSAPPPQHRRSQARPSLQRRFLLLPDCPIRATRVPLGAGGGLSVRLDAARISSSRAAAMAASRPAITCW